MYVQITPVVVMYLFAVVAGLVLVNYVMMQRTACRAPRMVHQRFRLTERLAAVERCLRERGASVCGGGEAVLSELAVGRATLGECAGKPGVVLPPSGSGTHENVHLASLPAFERWCGL